jgi:DNA-binding HxlR family transcriptional regulator
MWRCAECPPVPEEVRRAADLLGRRWSLAVLYASHSGARRFNQFSQALGSVPPRTLAQRLSELEAAGVLERVVVPTRPPQVEYRLTADGQRLALVIDGLREWSERRARTPAATS